METTVGPGLIRSGRPVRPSILVQRNMQQDEAIDFSLKSTLPGGGRLGTCSPIGEPQLHHLLPMDQMNPFAMLSSNGGVALTQMSPALALVTSQLLPTTSLAITALQRRRRRVASEISDGAGTAKKQRTIPNEHKDDAYWERRRKNNEAAKRSRDARKAKEEEIAFRAAYLEQENLKLKAQLAALKSELNRLQSVLYKQRQ